MRAMKRVITVLLFLICALNSYARIGMGEWSCETPNKSKIDNFSGNGLTLRLKNGQQVQDLSKWYFYKESIAGQLNNRIYFVANERTHTINYFQTDSDFKNFVKIHKYKPVFWTRWHTTNWAPLDDILFIALLFLPFSVIIIIILLIICYKAIIIEKLNYRKPFTVIIIGLLSIILLNIMLERFPQSI